MSSPPPPLKKVRSCSSSEETSPLFSPATLLEAARHYHSQARQRHSDALRQLDHAQTDVQTAKDNWKRAQERLGHVEAAVKAAAHSWQEARDYLARWESLAREESVLVRRKRVRVAEHGWGTYEGMLDELGEPHGRGSIVWEKGGKYVGEWREGKASGHGVMEYPNGDRFEGHWREGSRCGHGTHHFKDGGVYSGQWRNSAPDGQGRMTLKNGSHYVGSWKEGKWHGPGIVRPVNGGEWEGIFAFGKCTSGTLRRPNGEVEIGRFDSVNPDDIKEGVWWSIDRATVWRVEEGQKVEEINYQRALEIAEKIGVEIPSDAIPGGGCTEETVGETTELTAEN